MELIISLVLAFIALLATIYGITYYYLTTRHKERMALIESGLDPSTFTASSRMATFVLMLSVIVTVGITPAMVITSLFEIKGYSFSAFPYMYLMAFPFFTGLSLFICYFIIKNRAKKENKK